MHVMQPAVWYGVEGWQHRYQEVLPSADRLCIAKGFLLSVIYCTVEITRVTFCLGADVPH